MLYPVDDVVDESDDNDETEADTENDTENEEDEKYHRTVVILSTHIQHISHDNNRFTFTVCYFSSD